MSEQPGRSTAAYAREPFVLSGIAVVRATASPHDTRNLERTLKEAFATVALGRHGRNKYIVFGETRFVVAPPPYLDAAGFVAFVVSTQKLEYGGHEAAARRHLARRINETFASARLAGAMVELITATPRSFQDTNESGE